MPFVHYRIFLNVVSLLTVAKILLCFTVIFAGSGSSGHPVKKKILGRPD